MTLNRKENRTCSEDSEISFLIKKITNQTNSMEKSHQRNVGIHSTDTTRHLLNLHKFQTAGDTTTSNTLPFRTNSPLRSQLPNTR